MFGYTIGEVGRCEERIVSNCSIGSSVKVKAYQSDHRQGLAALGEHLLALARAEGCGKVLAEVREGDWEQFLGRGFTLEGLIPGYFAGEPAYGLSYFVDPARQASGRLDHDNEIREQVLSPGTSP